MFELSSNLDKYKGIYNPPNYKNDSQKGLSLKGQVRNFAAIQVKISACGRTMATKHWPSALLKLPSTANKRCERIHTHLRKHYYEKLSS